MERLLAVPDQMRVPKSVLKSKWLLRRRWYLSAGPGDSRVNAQRYNRYA